MITREQIEKILGDDKTPFQNKEVDHKMVALNLLRDRIPYSVCYSIIIGVGHEQIYLVDTYIAIEFLNLSDLYILSDCNCFIDEDNDCISMFV